MAGQYVNIIVPGYSSLYVRDLSYTPGTGEPDGLNPFNPDSDSPLVEGEWLERTGADKLTRGGDLAVAEAASAGTATEESDKPAFLYFNERGRYDVQLTRRAHIIQGPAGFEFRTRLVVDDTYSVGDKVSVWYYDGPSGAWGTHRRVLGKAGMSNAYVVGYVTRVFGSSDIAVMYSPGVNL
jgi:hypothetical protein